MPKKKILLLSDDLRMTSGISTMSKEIVIGTIHKYDWVQLGAGINHPELGKVIDVSQDVRNRTGIHDANLKIIPYNGYGDIGILRKLINEEKPDAILHFTDPHYWQWLYDNEFEVRQQVPLLFYHIWDNLPDPKFNRDYYESCDWIGCISKQTYGIVHRVGKSDSKVTYTQLKNNQISYVPHGINSNLFKPLENVSKEIRDMVHGEKEYDFVLFYNNRNIRRKQPADVIYAYRLFCDMLPKEQSDKCLLFMHTTAVDNNGTDLYAVVDSICEDYDVKINGIKLEQDRLNEIYNTVDCTINIANNEGFGLATAESLMSGTPIIVNVTGGLQDQCGFNAKIGEKIINFNHEDYIVYQTLHDKNILNNFDEFSWGEWVIPVWSSAININGSVPTPYIFDDRVNVHDVANAIKKTYDQGREQRKNNGLKGREFMINNLSSEIMCNTMMEGIDNTINNFKPKKKHNLYKIV
jgi:glycosyltransferase involved in cell wall biosynthesis